MSRRRVRVHTSRSSNNDRIMWERLQPRLHSGLNALPHLVRSERIAYPPNAIFVNRHNIEAHDVIRVEAMSRDKQHSRMYEFALLALVDCQQGVDKLAGATVSDFDESQAAPVQHDEVDFAAPAAKISCDRAQALVNEIAKRLLLGALA